MIEDSSAGLRRGSCHWKEASLPKPARRRQSGFSWGPSVLAEVHPEGGDLGSWSCTCSLHKLEGMRCNKSLTVGGRQGFTSAQARHRIKYWPSKGYFTEDGLGAKKKHMDIDPGEIHEDELISERESWTPQLPMMSDVIARERERGRHIP